MLLKDYRQLLIQALSSHSDSAQIDVDLLLMHGLKKSRTELLLYLNDVITEKDQSELNIVVARRRQGEPIAYILGHQPFWTMDLIVTPDTLIPRPETECLIDYVLAHSKNKALKIADLGTGTGAIAIALALEKPDWEIDATDMSEKALSIAKLNAKQNNVDRICFYRGNWCNALPKKKYNILISNPPYIAEQDSHLEKLKYEPLSALVSKNNGLNDIEKIISQAKDYLTPDGLLIIEHGFDQGSLVFGLFKQYDYTDIQNHRDLAGNLRFVTARSQ